MTRRRSNNFELEEVAMREVAMREMAVLDENFFASSSVRVHLIRGAIGLTLLIAAFALIPTFGPLTLLLAPFGVVALRGCPTCWAIGLIATISRGRLERACVGDQCALTGTDRRPAEIADPHGPAEPHRPTDPARTADRQRSLTRTDPPTHRPRTDR